MEQSKKQQFSLTEAILACVLITLLMLWITGAFKHKKQPEKELTQIKGYTEAEWDTLAPEMKQKWIENYISAPDSDAYSLLGTTELILREHFFNPFSVKYSDGVNFLGAYVVDPDSCIVYKMGSLSAENINHKTENFYFIVQWKITPFENEIKFLSIQPKGV